MGERLRREDATPEPLPVPTIAVSGVGTMSTQEGFGKAMIEVAKSSSPLAKRIVTTSPDVTVSTNLGGWVNLTGLSPARPQADVFRDRKLLSAQKWMRSPNGQHIELGIAENNLFLMLSALGPFRVTVRHPVDPGGYCVRSLHRERTGCAELCLLSGRALRLGGHPSGLTLAPEGGAHQSVITPLIGMGQPGLTMFEPAYVDELAAILRWSFDHVQRAEGGSVYLRLSTRPLEQLSRPI